MSGPAGREDERWARPPSLYARYRYLERAVYERLRGQERKMHLAQLALDAVLAKKQHMLIRSEWRLWEAGCLNDEPARRRAR